MAYGVLLVEAVDGQRCDRKTDRTGYQRFGVGAGSFECRRIIVGFDPREELAADHAANVRLRQRDLRGDY